MSIVQTNLSFKVLAFALSLMCLTGCSMRENEKANQLYLEAATQMQQAKDSGGSYNSILQAYEKARQKIELLIKRYPASEIGIGLSSGQAKITGLTWDVFRDAKAKLIAGAEAEKDLLSCALFIIREALEEKDKAIPFSKIAMEYARRGDADEAEKYWALSLQYANTEYSTCYELHVFYEIERGVSFAQLKSLSKITSSSSFNPAERVYNRISEKYAKMGKYSDALEAAKSINSGGIFFKALGLIAEQMIQAEETAEEVIQIARLRQHPDSLENFIAPLLLDEFLAGVAKSYADKNKFYEALAISKTIKANEFEINALIQIANASSQAGSTNMVELVLKLIADVPVDGQFFMDNPNILTSIGLLYGSIGDGKKMGDALDASIRIVKSENFKKSNMLPTAMNRGPELKEMILACLGAEGIDQAWRLAESCTEILFQLDDGLLGPDKIKVIECYADKGYCAKALSLDRRLDPPWKGVALEYIANIYVKNDRLDDALDIAKQLGAKGSSIMEAIAIQYAKDGRLSDAMQLGAKGSSIMEAIAIQYAKDGRLSDAISVAKRIPPSQYGGPEFLRLSTLIKISSINVGSDSKSENNQLLSESLSSIAKFESNRQKAMLLIRASAAFYDTGFQLSDADLLVLKKIVCEASPCSTIWK